MLVAAAIVAFALAATYAIGGRGFVARLLQFRTRAAATIQASLQPPTQSQLQEAARTAARDTASVLAETGPPPASAGLIVVTVATILGTAVATFYVTGRRGPRR